MAGRSERPTLAWAGKHRPGPDSGPVAAARRTLSFGPIGDAPDELYRGDNLEVLAGLRERVRGRVDLIYLDPPFCSQAAYKRTIRLRTPAGRRPSFQHPQYGDTWTDDGYLQFMYERLSRCHELLGERGAIFVHCDWHQSHRLRCVLDELFGAENFQNEIVWHYYNKLQGNVGRFAANHDSILYYSKSSEFTFNRLRERRAQPVRQLERVWNKEKRAIVNARDADGKIRYVMSTHKTIDDVWRMSMLQPADRREATGYPTQKPEALLERIIAAASEPGALVLDPFMGSGTAAAVAVKLGRRFIGVDSGGAAVHTTLRRLLHTREALARGERAASIKNGLGEVVAPSQARVDAGVDVYELGERGADAQRDGVHLAIVEHRLVIAEFQPSALAATIKAAIGEVELDDWRALVDAIYIDFDHDGEVLRAAHVDAPRGRERVCGVYELPPATRRVAVAIVDVLGEVWTACIDPSALAENRL